MSDYNDQRHGDMGGNEAAVATSSPNRASPSRSNESGLFTKLSRLTRELFAPSDPQVQEHGVSVTLDELLALRFRLARMGLPAGQNVMTPLAGQYRSGFRGRGLDFDEVRVYQPGDDVRTIDWLVTARTGQTYSKRYREERERPVFIMVDFRASMRFGTRVAFKSVIAARIAALLAWIASSQGDRVGGMIFSDQRHGALQPAGGKRGVMRLLRLLVSRHHAALKESGSDSPHRLASRLEELRRLIHPGSLLFILSDFEGLDGEAERQLAALSRFNDVAACLLFDPIEGAPPPPGIYPVGDGQRTHLIDLKNPSVRAGYTRDFHNHREHLKQLLARQRVHMMPLATHHPIEESVRMLLGIRSGRSRALPHRTLTTEER